MAEEANMRTEAASDKTKQGTDAALDSIAQFRGAAQEQGNAALQGAHDRYQAAKEVSAQKGNETADVAQQKKATVAVNSYSRFPTVSNFSS